MQIKIIGINSQGQEETRTYDDVANATTMLSQGNTAGYIGLSFDGDRQVEEVTDLEIKSIKIL